MKLMTLLVKVKGETDAKLSLSYRFKRELAVSTRVEITNSNPSHSPRAEPSSCSVLYVRVGCPASLIPSQDVEASSFLCVRVHDPALLDPAWKLRNRHHPAASRRRHGRDQVNSRSRANSFSHGYISSASESQAVSAPPSCSQSLFKPWSTPATLVVGIKALQSLLVMGCSTTGSLVQVISASWPCSQPPPSTESSLAVGSVETKLSISSNGDFFNICKTGPRNLDYLHIRPKLLKLHKRPLELAPNLLIVQNNPSEYSEFAEMDLELLDVLNSAPNFVNCKNNPRFSPKLLK
ncbi:hypothetical protein IGI04_012303 [Brassica rapa subsp. trilocularis]|uniref:Uncharacterized protein n=1 Tax=Brassica rapa subsp. trilocularis TaxID=1813537 RepID=A0ABQ7N8U0_BRACM|nr:hypothetical protein IGI04_012303 [Brassica rapa subsp. trilocularis]